MEIPVRLDFDRHAPAFSAAMSRLDRAAREELERVGFDPRLAELVRVRASQLNGCAYCLDMHSKDLRAIGETEQRIYTLEAWRECPWFTDRERAALAWTEALTQIATHEASDAVYEEARRHFDEKALVDLTLAIVAINGWNRMNVAFRTPVGSYVSPHATAR